MRPSDLDKKLEALQEQTFLLQKMFIAITELHQSLQPERVCRTIFEVLRDFVGASRSALVLLPEGGGAPEVVVEQIRGRPDLTAAQQQALCETPALRTVLSTGNSWFYHGLGDTVPSNGTREPWEPLLIYPLLLKGRRLGCFCVLEFGRQKRRVEPIDYQFFTLLSEHAGSALASARLHRRAEAELSTLRGISEAVMRTLDVHRSSEAALSRLSDAIPADGYWLFGGEPDAPALELWASLPQGQLPAGFALPCAGSMVGLLAARGVDAPELTGGQVLAARLPEEGFFLPTMMACNVMHAGRALATVLIGRHDATDLFTQDQRELLQTACNQMAAGLQNAVYFKQIERQRNDLDLARRDAERASRFKTEFLANMSHEIRTPMNAIIGFAEILYEDETDHERLRKFGIIREAGHHLLSILNDVLDLSKIEAGKVTLVNAPFAPHSCLERVRDIFTFRTAEKGIELKVLIDLATPEHLLGDEHRIRQVLINLVGNAVKFTERGTISLECGWHDGVFKLVVADTGIGMDEEQQARAFASFEQADVSTPRKYGGSGLGLTISRSLVHLMGGAIELQSQPGQGTSFTVKLPLPVADAPPPPPRQRRSSLLGKQRRVGYVEDDAAAEQLVREILERNGFVPVELHLGEGFIDQVVEAQIDLLLLDLVVSGGNALEFNDALKTDPRTAFMPVVVCSVEDEGTLRGSYGYVDYVQKPLNEADLVRRIQAALRLRRSDGHTAVFDEDPGQDELYRRVLGPSCKRLTFHRAASHEATAAFIAEPPDLVVIDAGFGQASPEEAQRLVDFQLELAQHDVPVVVFSSEAVSVGAPDSQLRARLVALSRDLDEVLRKEGERIERQQSSGETMVQHWLEAQGIAELQPLLLDNIRNRLFREIGRLEEAILAERIDDVRRHAHAIKGWSGTYKMTEIYDIVRTIEEQAKAEPPQLADLERSAFELGEVLSRIPSHYLAQLNRPPVPAPGSPEDATIRVLIVDDNAINRELCVTLLSRRGIGFHEAVNGEEALAQLREHDYDLVLLDMEMPVMDGWTTIGHIRADPRIKDSYVVALTAHALSGAGERCLAAGCDTYLAKPLDKEAFYQLVEARLR